MRILEQKESRCINWKKLLVDLLTLINSTVMAGTYFKSFDDFPWHNKILDYQLTDSREGLPLYVLGIGTVMCIVVLASNQCGMASHISKFLRNVWGMQTPKISKSKISRPVIALMTIGAVCKGIISSSSLLSTVRDYTGEWRWSSACSGISLIGNIGATAVVLLEHTDWRGHWRPCVARSMALLVAILYGASQGCLYSNALFNPALLTGVLTRRPGIDSDYTGNLLMGLTAYPLLEFTICSGQVIYQKTCKVLGSEATESKRTQPSRYQKWRGGVASGFRTLGLLAAVFSFFYFCTDKNLPVTCLLTVLSLLAAPGVCAVLYPLPKFTRGPDLFTSAADYRPLPINAPDDDDSDDEQYLVPYLP